MKPDLLARYGGPVPRYTSYPTAPHFQPGIGEADYRALLSGLGPDDGLSLYFHVPFCAEMCWYCGCHTKVVKRYRPVAAFAGRLEREIGLVADALPADAAEVVHVHWGGGTPTMLEPDDFARLMDAARRHFALAADAEVAVEIDPRTLDAAMAGALAAAGVTRASLGVQDFNAHVQDAINRHQPFETTAAAVAALRGAGIAAINFDLMYGLPGQTVADVVRSVERAAELAPDRLAVFGYAHVPWMKTHQRMIDEKALPDAAARMAQAGAAGRRLVELGYRAIGLDHFAKPGDALSLALDAGRLRRNFQGYTTDRAKALLGFGPSAIGSLPGGYVQNEPAMPAYARLIDAGTLPVTRGIRLSDDDRMRRDVIERLMCQGEADLDAAADAFGLDEGFEDALAALRPMAADGLVAVDGHRVRVTETGRPWVRTVAAAFDRYLATGRGRHSQAV